MESGPHVSWTHLTHHHRRHLDRASCFSTIHVRYQWTERQRNLTCKNKPLTPCVKISLTILILPVNNCFIKWTRLSQFSLLSFSTCCGSEPLEISKKDFLQATFLFYHTAIIAKAPKTRHWSYYPNLPQANVAELTPEARLKFWGHWTKSYKISTKCTEMIID